MFLAWRRDWDQINAAAGTADIELPKGAPVFLGYVMQQHNIRRNSDGMARGWSIFGDKVKNSVKKNIIDVLSPFCGGECRTRHLIPGYNIMTPFFDF